MIGLNHGRPNCPLRVTQLGQCSRKAGKPAGPLTSPRQDTPAVMWDRFEKAQAVAEGLVSKHRDRAYRAGTSPNWVKVKNRGSSRDDAGRERRFHELPEDG
jgi:hypothetical protein